MAGLSDEKDKNSNDSDKKLTKSKSNNGKYPKVVFLIILNELCERFSFYGMRTVLYIYFSQFLMLNSNTSTALYHAYSMWCYFAPILGAIIADGFIGLYKTILSLSIVYFIGEVVVTATSMKPLGAPNIIGPVIGLAIIGFGTGGIKPCVGAFGGNQFDPSQTRYINTFFSVFYMSINIGSTVGTILTPIFRSDIKCFNDDCYPLAFGVPAALMGLAIISFVLGTRYYKRNKPSGKNVIIETVVCIFRAITNSFRKSKKPAGKKDHWLDYADTHHSKQVISNVKAFLRIALVFLPVPIFWTLYDQQGSRWTDQAIQLNGRIGSSFVIKPDQMQAVNPILIIILIPLFDFVIYPLFAKINIFKSLLQRMVVGMIFAVLSFLVAAFLESQMQKSSLSLNPNNQIRVVNLLPCTMDIYDEQELVKLASISESIYLENQVNNLPSDLVNSISNDKFKTLNIKYTCSNGLNFPTEALNVTNKKLPKSLIFFMRNNKTQSMEIPYNNNDQLIGSSQVKFTSINVENFGALNPVIQDSKVKNDGFAVDSLEISNSSSSSYKSIDYSMYHLKVYNSSQHLVLDSSLFLASCGRYTIILFGNSINNNLDYVLLTDIYPTQIHIAWQVIQILVISIGEVLFSISGIAFAYSQAPISMKSACQALWYIDVAIGNLIVVIVAESRVISNQVYEYIFFAGLMAVATVILFVLAIFYKYPDNNTNDDEASKSSEKSEKNGGLNLDAINDDDIELVF